MDISRQRLRRPGDRPVLYGRDRERAQLRAVVTDAESGHGSLVLVSGEAGIGKTTLVDDLVYEARERDCMVLAGGCYDLTTTPPYGPWLEVLGSFHPDGSLPTVPAWFSDPDAMAQVGNQTTLFDEAYRFFVAVAEHQPLIIVLEDLHWADSASLEALRYIARTLRNDAVLLVATYREEEITRGHDLYQLLPILVRESRVQRIHLSRLARHEIWEMVTGRYNLPVAETERLVLHLSARSQGNPFFAEEILQDLHDEQVLQPVTGGWKLGDLEQMQIPTLLRQAINARLDRLSRETRVALRLAALIGQLVPLDLWQTLSRLDRDAFEQSVMEALDAQVLQEDRAGQHLRFRHALLREALYDSLTPVERRTKHRIVGETLAGIANVDPGAVAHHFQAAGDLRAATWLIRAGVRAEGSYALQLAAQHHDAAQEILAADAEAAQARGWLLFHIGHLLRYSDEERSIDYLANATHIARQVDDPVLEAQSHHTHGLLRCFQGKVGRGLAEMETTIRVLDVATTAHERRAEQAITFLFPSEIRSNPSASPGGSFFHVGRVPGVNTLIHTYVMWLALAGRFAEAMDIGQAFVDQVTSATADTLLIQDTCRDAYYGLSFAADWLGRPDAARRWRYQAREAYEAIGHRALATAVRGEELLHLLAYKTEQLVERRRCAEATTVSIEGIAEHQLGRGSSVLLDLIEGRWDESHKFALSILEERDPYAQYFRLWIYKIVGREQQDEQLAATSRADIHAVLPDGPATQPGQQRVKNTVIARELAAELALDAEELRSAHAWITAHDRWIDWSGSVLGRAEAQLLWSRYYRVSGDLERARQHARRALDHASDPRQPLALIAAHRALGQIGVVTERLDQARGHLQTSLELAERCEAPYERALTLLEIAELAAHSGDTAESRQVLVEVRAICELLDARRSLERVDEILARLGVLVGEFPAGLSGREVEVLEQAATGMTNVEIGEELFISPRTVAQHLRSVYNKLGVNNRAAAVARWSDLSSN